MSLFWEPRWVRKRIVHEGMEIVTCQDEVNKLYLCPLCIDIDKVCPEGRATNFISEDMVTFFTISDLVNHMRTHGSPRYEKRISVSKGRE
ncbi:MAG: hypothetical protein DRO09_03135 [Thermoprotei archaeon]|nr:MAG: hypothetical protein DRO09_03135 [Thermoprotei archaeon]